MECKELVKDIYELLEKIEDKKFLNRIYISVRDYVYVNKQKGITISYGTFQQQHH